MDNSASSSGWMDEIPQIQNPKYRLRNPKKQNHWIHNSKYGSAKLPISGWPPKWPIDFSRPTGSLGPLMEFPSFSCLVQSTYKVYLFFWHNTLESKIMHASRAKLGCAATAVSKDQRFKGWDSWVLRYSWVASWELVSRVLQMMQNSAVEDGRPATADLIH